MGNVDSEVFRPFEVSCDNIVFPEGGEEVVPVFFFFVFDPKVVDNESESDVAGLVFEETGGVGALVVPIVDEMENEFVLGDALRNSISYLILVARGMSFSRIYMNSGSSMGVPR